MKKETKCYLIEDDIYLEFKKKCYNEDTTPSQNIRKMIKEYIKYNPNKISTKIVNEEEKYDELLKKYIDDDIELINMIEKGS